jgi:hypothetical protein
MTLPVPLGEDDEDLLVNVKLPFDPLEGLLLHDDGRRHCHSSVEMRQGNQISSTLVFVCCDIYSVKYISQVIMFYS